MRIRLFLLLSSVLMISWNAAAIADCNGFKGYEWGTDFRQMKKPFDLVLSESNGNDRLYKSNVTSVGEVAVQRCDLDFYKGKFVGVFIMTDAANAQKLLATIEQGCGRGYQPDAGSGTYFWFSKEASIIYEASDAAGACTVWFYSKKLVDEQAADEIRERIKAVAGANR